MSEENDICLQYQSDMDKIEVLLLYLLSSEYDSSSSISTMRWNAHIDALEVARRMNQPRYASPLSHFIWEEQIHKESEYFMLLEDEMGIEDVERLKNEILLNLKQTTDSEWFHQKYRAYESSEGVLSWRESFIASKVDSSRCRITNEELRLQGDWLTHWNFSESAGISRFIRGGYGIINDRAFFERPAPVHLRRFEMLVYPPLNENPLPWRFHFIRVKDWGWMGISSNSLTDVCLCSFDRYSNSSTTGDATCTHQYHGTVAPVRPLTTPLKDDPMHQLYKL